MKRKKMKLNEMVCPTCRFRCFTSKKKTKCASCGNKFKASESYRDQPIVITTPPLQPPAVWPSVQPIVPPYEVTCGDPSVGETISSAEPPPVSIVTPFFPDAPKFGWEGGEFEIKHSSAEFGSDVTITTTAGPTQDVRWV
jgi:hypothetical protein